VALKPILKKWDRELEAWTWGLLPDDFMKVLNGYACGRCLEEFEFWVAKCPVCGEVNEPRHSELPSEWKGY